ncbi:MAG: cupin domain-containing protein [Anaerolineaceae bacterium]|nr:cupin domain-containing protein [Anaerolineaceae bacterium]
MTEKQNEHADNALPIVESDNDINPFRHPFNRCADFDVGRRLNALRLERGFSIRTLAAKSGLAVNTLSLIENGKTSPSVSTLHQLAIAMQIPITSFFEPPIEKEKVLFSKPDQRRKMQFNETLLEDLGTCLPNWAVQPMLVTLKPGAGSGDPVIVHTGYEFAYCLEGTIQYEVHNEGYILTPGCSLLFEAHLPHQWKNISEVLAKLLLIVYAASEFEKPAERHFGFD